MTANGLIYENPAWFWLFALLPILGIWYYLQYYRQRATLRVPSIKGLEIRSAYTRLRPLLLVLRLLALSAIVMAMVRPRIESVSTRTKTTRGIDIMMVIDVSTSMYAQDLNPNRLEALKKVASNFVDNRPNDRIGVVAYAGESFTKTPLTTDKAIVKNTLKGLAYGELEDGTAIGMGLATAVNRIKDSKAKSKVIILLSDGVNNTGFVEPTTAADLAAEMGIKTYTIGLGSNGNAKLPVELLPNNRFRYAYRKVELDEDLLKEIAEKTGGRYFRATDNTRLEEIYNEINRMETTEIEDFSYYSYEEKYRPWVYWALGLLTLEWLLGITLFRSFI